MKLLLLPLLLLSFLTATAIDPIKTRKINRAKTEARDAYSDGDYKTAVAKYKYLTDSLQVSEEEVTLNLANAYYLLKDTAQAFTQYQSLAGSAKPEVRSKAQQQLGIMNHQKGQFEQALANFKDAIKANPANADARYNYEMVKKKLDEKKKEDEKKDKNKDKPKEPSAYAKKLKAQADVMAAEFRFGEALELMNMGMQKDPSVEYYKDYMDRLGDVVTINKQK